MTRPARRARASISATPRSRSQVTLHGASSLRFSRAADIGMGGEDHPSGGTRRAPALRDRSGSRAGAAPSRHRAASRRRTRRSSSLMQVPERISGMSGTMSRWRMASSRRNWSSLSAWRRVLQHAPVQACGSQRSAAEVGSGRPWPARELSEAREFLRGGLRGPWRRAPARSRRSRGRARRFPLLAHEQQRRRGREQQQRHRRAQRGFVRCEARQALAEGAVADLVVVLQEGDEGGRRQMGAGLAARWPPGGPRPRPGRRSPAPERGTAARAGCSA